MPQIDNLNNEDSVREMVERTVREIFGTEYRGYHIVGIGWSACSYKFVVTAYLLNSPLHPHDLMHVECGNEVNDWREYRKSCHADNAARSLRLLIDAAYDSPSSFLPTGGGVVSQTVQGIT